MFSSQGKDVQGSRVAALSSAEYTRLTLHGWPYSPIAGQSLRCVGIYWAQGGNMTSMPGFLGDPLVKDHSTIDRESQGIVEHKPHRVLLTPHVSFSEPKSCYKSTIHHAHPPP